MLEKFNKLVSDAPEGKSFYTDFCEIKNLRQLKTVIAERGSGFYFSYVNNKDNHFANWIENIFEDKELADELRNADSCDKVLSSIDNRISYAELWLNYNTNKELLNNYLANGELSLKRIMNSPDFNPEHRIFETEMDIDMHSITKVSPPRTTNIIQNFASIFQKKAPENVPETEVMKNAVLLNSTTQLRYKETIEEEREKVAFSYLEKMFPGVGRAAPVKNRNVLDRIISFFWK